MYLSYLLVLSQCDILGALKIHVLIFNNINIFILAISFILIYLCSALSPLFLCLCPCYFISFVSVALNGGRVCVRVCMRVCVCVSVCQFCSPEDIWQCLETF